MAGVRCRLRLYCVLSHCLLFVLLSPDGARTFNLDIKAPFVKRGSVDSYFGYSVAQHHIDPADGSRGGTGTPVILVGAPRDNITDPTASTALRRLVRPGAVYQCPYSSVQNDCTAVAIDRDEPNDKADRNDQWLGVSVASRNTSDGGALACGHRFKSKGPSFVWGLGICISMLNSLEENQYYEPCNGEPKDTGHSQYGFCQAGISSALSPDGDFVVGSPGPGNWRGTVFVNTIDPNVDPKWIQAPVLDSISTRPDVPEPAMPHLYSYLGMSAKIGRLIAGRKTFVSGAPRAKDSGQVLMFEKSPTASKYLTIRPEHYLTGDQFGSYFGYDLAVADFNADGKDDLAVGAPFYHGSGVGGAIYIYMNGPAGITSITQPLKIESRKMKDAECAQLNCQNARFGFALAAIGDLDRDGYPDLAVGAPYEGSGAVYIFHGSAQGLRREFSQRIAASNFPSSAPRSFGASLVGGMDIDQNGYPDVIVGSFESANVFALRARPVINLVATLTSAPAVIDPKVTECVATRVASTCFMISACARFSAEPKDRFTSPINVLYTLEAEKFAGAKISRVAFNGTTGADQSNMTRSLRLNPQSDPNSACIQQLAYIAKGTTDFLNPILFRLTFRLQSTSDPTMTPGGPLPDLNNFPILNNERARYQLSVDFVKDCGDDLKCESALSMTASLSLTKDRSGSYVLTVGVDKTVEVAIDVMNKGEDAHEATVTVTVPSSLAYQGTDTEGKQYSCTKIGDSVKCSIGNPLKMNAGAKFAIRFDATGAAPTRELLNITAVVNTTSIELNVVDNKAVLEMKVVHEADMYVRGQSNPETVYFEGEPRGESAMKYEDDIGSPVLHVYEIKNIGKAPVAKSIVTISWPNKVRHTEKNLLYIMDEPVLEGTGSCDIPNELINPLQIKGLRPKDSKSSDNNTVVDSVTEGANVPHRRKRDAKSDPGKASELKIGGGGSVTLDCASTAQCFQFTCVLGDLAPTQSMVIKIKARVWHTTLLQDFKDNDVILIRSKAEVKIDPSLNIQELNPANDVHWAETKAFPKEQAPEGIPIWVIIISVLAGVLLLVLLIVLLWKCGFFRRKTHEEMAEHKVRVEKSSTVDAYHDD